MDELDLNDPTSYDPGRASFKIYRSNPTDPTSLSHNSVWPILETSDGTLWVGTEGGLNRLNRENGTFTHFLEKDGLPNATTLGLAEDNQGYLWISTNNGLSRFDPRNATFTNYYSADGLQSNEYNSNAYLKTRAGILYFGGGNGLSIFDPSEIVPNEVPPSIAITSFNVFNQPVMIDQKGNTPIDLSYKQNFISFEFAALDYHSPAKNRYKYKLEGFDQEWIDSGSRHYANYTNLPGGNYTFQSHRLQ